MIHRWINRQTADTLLSNAELFLLVKPHGILYECGKVWIDREKGIFETYNSLTGFNRIHL
jgi:hypothetical protein